VDWLNYHHLLYFWVVAREGSIVRASAVLRLSSPTISSQIRELESTLGVKLFERKGRGLALTPGGRVAFEYADQIFSLGSEFVQMIKGAALGRPVTVVVGVSDVIAKSLVGRILEPAFALEPPVVVVCRTDRSVESFMTELAAGALDAVIADRPERGEAVRAFSHPLGTCGSVFMAAPRLAERLSSEFPIGLNDAPLIYPASDTTLRKALDEWLLARDLRPTCVAELDDIALAQELALRGVGVFVAPAVIADEVVSRLPLRVVGQAPDLRQGFYVISLERKIRHPAIVALCDLARARIFGDSNAD
jgi:LysR family transcriptional activator of nhaA